MNVIFKKEPRLENTHNPTLGKGLVSYDLIGFFHS